MSIHNMNIFNSMKNCLSLFCQLLNNPWLILLKIFYQLVRSIVIIPWIVIIVFYLLLQFQFFKFILGFNFGFHKSQCATFEAFGQLLNLFVMNFVFINLNKILWFFNPFQCILRILLFQKLWSSNFQIIE